MSNTFKVFEDLDGNINVAALREIKKNVRQTPLCERKPVGLNEHTLGPSRRGELKTFTKTL